MTSLRRTFLLAALTLSPLLLAQEEPEAEGLLLIRNVTIVSPEKEAPYGPIDVFIKEGQINAIGEVLEAPSLPAEQIIDAQGKYLTPGLIDSHVHLSTVPGMHGGHEAQFPEIAKEIREQIPRSYLYHGFTSLVDLISNSSFAQKWNAQEIRPQLYYCGGAPIQDGYPTQFIPEHDRYHAAPNFLLDPTRADKFPDAFDPADHSPEAVVNRIADDGAVGIKTFWEDGFGKATNIPVPPLEVLEELVAAAHKRDLPVIVHANSENAQAASMAAGVDGFAHGLWTWDSPDAPELTQPIKTILDGILEKGIAWQPSIQVLYGERDLFNPDFLTSDEIKKTVPQVALDWYASPDGQWMVEKMQAFDYVSALLKKGRWQDIDEQPIRHVTQALSYLSERNGKLLFGSDTPSAPTYANPAGFNGRLEMERWIQAGVAPKDILKAATIANATFFGVSDKIGTIEVGKQADLLLLSENPYDSIEAFDTIELVILVGKQIPRQNLRANLNSE